MIIEVENIKCGGCANSINQKLLQVEGIEGVSVDVESGRITLSTEQTSDTFRHTVLAKLTAMGYPEKGSLEGLGAVKAKATSYVSCAIGKISDS